MAENAITLRPDALQASAAERAAVLARRVRAKVTAAEVQLTSSGITTGSGDDARIRGCVVSSCAVVSVAGLVLL